MLANGGELEDPHIIRSARLGNRQVLERGRARGELKPDADLDAMIDLLFGALWYRLLLQHAKLDSRFAKQLVGSVLDGFTPR
jgi:hypothetical protein